MNVEYSIDSLTMGHSLACRAWKYFGIGCSPLFPLIYLRDKQAVVTTPITITITITPMKLKPHFTLT